MNFKIIAELNAQIFEQRLQELNEQGYTIQEHSFHVSMVSNTACYCALMQKTDGYISGLAKVITIEEPQKPKKKASSQKSLSAEK